MRFINGDIRMLLMWTRSIFEAREDLTQSFHTDEAV